MDRAEIIKIGRASYESMASDMKNVHNIILDIPDDEKSYTHGLNVIRWNEEDIARSERAAEADRRYLASLDPEYRQYILLKRKYEPTEHGEL